MRDIFGKRLKEIRIKNNELQKDLAEEIGVGVSMVSTWEKGLNYPKVEKLIQIAEYYNVTTDYLLGLNNKNQTQKNDTVKIINNYVNIKNK